MATTQIATLRTNLGDIRVQLFGDHAPKTVKNFVGLSDGTGSWTNPATGQPGEGALYSDVIFHRIIPNFMIQGGDPLGQGIGGPGYSFDDEIHPELNFNAPYILAMANAGLRRNAITGKAEGTNGSQFFITVGPTPHLQNRHTIFGEVADDASKAVVDAIASTATDGRDRPLEPVVIERVTIAG